MKVPRIGAARPIPSDGKGLPFQTVFDGGGYFRGQLLGTANHSIDHIDSHNGPCDGHGEPDGVWAGDNWQKEDEDAT